LPAQKDAEDGQQNQWMRHARAKMKQVAEESLGDFHVTAYVV
jgi:hypothetical protein